MVPRSRIGRNGRRQDTGRGRTVGVLVSVELLEDRCLLSAEGLGLGETVDFAPIPGSVDKSSQFPKLDTALLSTFQEWNIHQEHRGRSLFAPSHGLVQVDQGQVTIHAAAADSADRLMADLVSLGLENGTSFGSLVSGRLPIDALDDAAQLGSLQFVSAALRPRTNVGLVTSQGDEAMNADDLDGARATFGVDGTGVTVGVLSDSFDTGSVGSYAADIASGDLSAGVQVLDDFPGGTDEGRGMMQLIHDVAPGADLAFHTAFNGMADFAQGILDLAAIGADVIVDDVFYFEEPMFQDGIIAQAVDSVAASGVSYFSSAGNGDRQSYESAFVDSGVAITMGGEPRGNAHDFDPGPGVDYLQSITVPLLSGFVISFQWDDPFFSVSGGSGATSDLDIFIVDSAGTAIAGQSITRNIGGDAVEAFQFVNNVDLFGQFQIMITKFDGPDPGPGLMKYLWYDTGLSPTVINEYGTASSTTFGHANAVGAQAVGAAFYGDTPAFGQAPALLESFSSAGGTPILFDTAGNVLVPPEVRLKPDIVAPDGTNTSFFPAGNDTDGDGFPNFYGTSAAAPHAAAVAALMLEANPALSPTEVYAALQTTALEMDVVGFDHDTGHGLVQADLALGAIDLVPRLALSITDVAISEDGGSTTGTVTRWSVDTGAPLIVTLASSDTSEATVPETVTILADQQSASFQIDAVDDDLTDAAQTVTITATASGLLDGADTVQVTDDEPQLISQWASTVIDFSSQWSDPFNPIPDAWGAVQALGQPDTLTYGDHESAWEASTPDGTGEEYLLLGYDTPVLAIGVTVRESYGNGFVKQVDVSEVGTNTLHPVWSDTDPSLPGSLADFVASWPLTGFFVDALKITIDSFHNSDINGNGEGWEAIDAVELLGWTAPPPPPPASLGDRVWADLNGNGIQDPVESGVANVTVNLLDASGVTTLDTTTTDSAGLYTFTNLDEGDYVVEFVLLAEFDQFSPRSAGSDDTADSDADPLTGRTGVISLVAGQDETFWDAGLVSNDLVVTDDRAVAETTTSGTVTSGSYVDTHAADDTYEDITERHSGGKPQNRTSFLEHEWTFSVTGGDSVTFFVQASRTDSGEGDDFQLAYSTNGNTFIDMLSVTKLGDDDTYDQFALPNSLEGTVFVRVKDTDQTPSNNNLDTLFVDDMFIRSTSSPGSVTPVVTIVASDDAASEALLDPGQFTVSRIGTSGELTVLYEISGTATGGVDYRSISNSVTILDEDSSATIDVTPEVDQDTEGPETVILTLSTDAAYTIGSPHEATVTIADDGTPPMVTVDTLLTGDSTPALTGTVDDPAATISVDVGGQVGLVATNNGDGTWTLPDDTITTLPDGMYDVLVTATDSALNVGTDVTSDELAIDTTAPVVTVDTLLTSDSTPALTGTVDDPAATISVDVGGQVGLVATNNGDGTWTLPDDTITTLPDGTYDVLVTATDSALNVGTDATIDELAIDATAPVVTVDTLLTSDSTPALTGTVDDPAATISVDVGGQVGLVAPNNGDGTWTLPDDTITPLPDGTYEVLVTATDSALNVATDATSDELGIDTTAPLVTVDTLLTSDSTPALTGTVDDPAATISVDVGGQVGLVATNSVGVGGQVGLVATNNGDGTWTLPDDTITPLPDGTHDVLVTATDSAMNVGADVTANELTIDSGSASSADFDSDNDVDGDDFLAWQLGFGDTTGAMRADGDANNDGKVDGTDLGVWQEQYGQPVASTATALTISLSDPLVVDVVETSQNEYVVTQAAAVDSRGLAIGEVLPGSRHRRGHHHLRPNMTALFDEPQLPVSRSRVIDQAFHAFGRPMRAENHQLARETTLETLAKHIAVQGLDEDTLDTVWSKYSPTPR